jgi:hypothetical protein
MRILNCVFIAVFMAMLTLLLVFVDLSPDRVSVQENRMLANFPELSDVKRYPGTFIRGFDDWFKDSTGFREQLIKFYNVMDKNSWFNGGWWYMDGPFMYLVGEEGHHYYAGDSIISRSMSMIRKFQGKQFLTDSQLTNMAVKLEEVKTYLGKHDGIGVVGGGGGGKKTLN